MSEEKIYIDATDHVLGRLSSWIAQRILRGQRIVVVNSENAIVSGKRGSVIEDRLQKRARATHTNPNRGPFYPRFPDRIIRRTVRGMIPWKKPSGKKAFKRLMAYIDVPEELEGIEFRQIEDAIRYPSKDYVTLGDLGQAIGWQNKVEN